MKGRTLVAPRGWKVRPTSDRVREAIFSRAGGHGRRRSRTRPLLRYRRAGDRGALARAAHAVMVDRDTRPALGNVEPPRPGRPRRADPGRRGALARGRRRRLPAASRFDLVFVDAPYRLADRVGRDLDIHLPRLLAAGGRVVVESGAGSPLRIDSLERLRQRRYGAADVSFYGESMRARSEQHPYLVLRRERSARRRGDERAQR